MSELDLRWDWAGSMKHEYHEARGLVIALSGWRRNEDQTSPVKSPISQSHRNPLKTLLKYPSPSLPINSPTLRTMSV